MWMGYFCVITMWLSWECLWSTQKCANTRTVIYKLFTCQELCKNKILIGLTCLQRHASRTRRRRPWWCGSCHPEIDHRGRWPLAQPACGWRSVTAWSDCACRHEKNKKKENQSSRLHHQQSNNRHPVGLKIRQCKMNAVKEEYSFHTLYFQLDDGLYSIGSFTRATVV